MYYPADICDAHFDLKRLHLCTLLIETDYHRLSYAVLDDRYQKIVLLKEVISSGTIPLNQNEITAAINEDTVFNARFSKFVVSLVTEKFVLVPAAFFDENKVSEIFTLNNVLDEGESLKVFPLKMPLSYLIYATSSANEFISTGKFLNANFIPHVAVLIQTCMQRFRYKQNPVITIHCRVKAFEMIIVSENKLQLCNTYKYENSEDFIYYILFACEQLSLNPETTETYLSGEVAIDSVEDVMLKKYMRNISFLSKTLNHGFSNEFNQIQPHRFTTLFDLTLCES